MSRLLNLVLFSLLLAACGRGPANASLNGSTYGAVTCEDSGREYAIGSTFPSSDGCNTCTCRRMTDGSAASICTLSACSY